MKKEDRANFNRSKILEIAIEAFGAKGYDQASTNEICEICGVSKGLVFYHFKSKECLFEECVIYCIKQFDNYMKEHFIKGRTPLEGVKSCCLYRKKFFVNNPFYHSIFCEVLYGRNNNIKETIYEELIKRYQFHNCEMIAKVLEGIPLNPKIDRDKIMNLAIFWIDMVDAQIRNRYATNETEQMLDDQMRQYEDILEILFYGILEH